jgi:ABC-type lipoprotein export system ATPase subunit
MAIRITRQQDSARQALVRQDIDLIMQQGNARNVLMEHFTTKQQLNVKQLFALEDSSIINRENAKNVLVVLFLTKKELVARLALMEHFTVLVLEDA